MICVDKKRKELSATLHPFMHTFALGIALPHVEVGQGEKSGD